MPPSRPRMIAWSGAVYRATSYDVPLWAHPNRRSARWNTAGDDCPTNYTCLDAEGPWAEVLRWEGIRTDEVAREYRTTIWQLRVDEGAIVDYATFEKAEAAGFPPTALVDDDQERCRAEAVRLRGTGARGVLSPSAALPGTVCLTLFGPRVQVSWTTKITLASMVAAQKLTTGAPPDGLAARTRHYGTPHSGLASFLAARQPLLEIPDDPHARSKPSQPPEP